MKNDILFYSDQKPFEVTGSKHFIKYKDNLIMLDAGFYQSDEEHQVWNKEYACPVEDISTIIISHAHLDHSALLPKLVKDGYNKKIYSTPATRDLASIIMLDAAKIQKNDNDIIYEEKDVINTLELFRTTQYRKRKELNKEVTFTLYNAGHILGSAVVDVEINKKRNFIQKLFCKQRPIHILYTGDLGRSSNLIVEKPDTNIPAPDYIIMESTYGSRNHEKTKEAYAEMEQVINDTIKRGGKVIIPTFAIERAQELIYHIKNMMADNKIPRVPVYVDSPMASNATGVFSIHPECFNDNIKKLINRGKNPFSVKSLKFISSNRESLKVAEDDTPGIVLSASGMCEAGRIINHLKFGIENENNTILIVGYMAENTLGRKILDKMPQVEIQKKIYDLKAQVKRIDGFSGHADKEELLNYIDDLKHDNLKKIFLVHGDKESKESLKEALENKGLNVEILKDEKVYKL